MRRLLAQGGMEVVVLDEFERGVGVISGCLHLPSAERVLRALGLADDWAALEAGRWWPAAWCLCHGRHDLT